MRSCNHRLFRAIGLVLAVPVIAACGGGDQEEMEEQPPAETAYEESADEAAVTVRIVEPAPGSMTGSNVNVVLETEGIEIVSITPPVVGTGHHHLYVDADLTPLNEMIPQGDANIIHMGDGSAEYMLEGLSAGEHRLIAVVANPAHIPLDPPVVDTLHFTVEGG